MPGRIKKIIRGTARKTGVAKVVRGTRSKAQELDRDVFGEGGVRRNVRRARKLARGGK